jgi:hypothetical protein
MGSEPCNGFTLQEPCWYQQHNLLSISCWLSTLNFIGCRAWTSSQRLVKGHTAAWHTTATASEYARPALDKRRTPRGYQSLPAELHSDPTPFRNGHVLISCDQILLIRPSCARRHERADLQPEPDARAGAPPTGALPGSAALWRSPEADELHAGAQPRATQVRHSATDGRLMTMKKTRTRLPVERDATGTAHRRPDIGLKHSPFPQLGGAAGERAPFYGSGRQRIALNIALVSPATIRQGDELSRGEGGEARAVAERPRLGLCAPGVLHLGRANCRLPPLPGPSRGANGA